MERVKRKDVVLDKNVNWYNPTQSFMEPAGARQIVISHADWQKVERRVISPIYSCQARLA